MIRYSLKCANGHGFDSWFRSAEAFDALRAAGHLSCPDCGTGAVEKALMTPCVRSARDTDAPARSAGAPAQAPEPAAGPLSAPASPHAAALAELRRRLEENSDYVGLQFAAEARRMHAGEVPERPIHGEAKPEEARALLEEGVPVAPLPFLPLRKAN